MSFPTIEAFMKQHDWDGAIAECRAILQVQPTQPRLHAYLGLCFFSKAEWQAAAGCFSRATALDPNFWEAGAKHVQCLQRMNMHTEAYELAQEWLRVQPNDNTLRGLAEYLAPLSRGRKDGWERTAHLAHNVRFTRE